MWWEARFIVKAGRAHAWPFCMAQETKCSPFFPCVFGIFVVKLNDLNRMRFLFLIIYSYNVIYYKNKCLKKRN